MDQRIPDGAKLVLVGKRSFNWDPNNKGPNMKLNNKNLTATNMSHSDFEPVFGSISMNSDTHYWEVKINYIRDMNDVMIGVSQGMPKIIDTRNRMSPYERFYAWHATAGRKMRPHPSGNGKPEQSDYGQHAKQGDTIGCILEFKGGLGQITFVKNGVSF